MHLQATALMVKALSAYDVSVGSTEADLDLAARVDTLPVLEVWWACTQSMGLL